MIKKSLIVLVAIIAVAGLVFAASGDKGKSDTTNSNNLEKQQNINDTSNLKSSNTSTTTEISASKAQEMAQKYILEPGAKAGTPKLTNINGNKVYVIPVIYNGQTSGEIWIDAQTGGNVGGAGGP